MHASSQISDLDSVSEEYQSEEGSFSEKMYLDEKIHDNDAYYGKLSARDIYSIGPYFPSPIYQFPSYKINKQNRSF